MRFLLVDRITEVKAPDGIVGLKVVAMTEAYLEHHFPEQPILPGMLILESAVQLAGWLEAERTACAQWLLLEKVRSAKYVHFVVPGDTLTLEATCSERTDTHATYRVAGTLDGKRQCDLEFTGRFVALATLMDPDEAKRDLNVLKRQSPLHGGGRTA